MLFLKLFGGFVVWMITNRIIEETWFKPKFFGDTWRKLNNYTPEQVQEINGRFKQAVPFAILALLVTYAVTAIMFHLIGGVTPLTGAVLGILFFFGYTGSMRIVDQRFAGKPLALWLIDASYMIIEFAILGAVVGYLV